MSVSHAAAGEPVCVEAAPGSTLESKTVTLIKTASLEVLRLVLPAGKQLSHHKVRGEITLQCLKGSVTLQAGETSCELAAGMVTYLVGGQEHSVAADEDSTLLLTILLSPKAA